MAVRPKDTMMFHGKIVLLRLAVDSNAVVEKGSDVTHVLKLRPTCRLDFFA